MEASSLTTASTNGVLTRRTPLLRLQGDERLVALIREGHDRAFEVLFNRYQSRLLAFCRHLVGSPQDAEDVLQEVFAAAHAAMLADNRPINARPWLYRIARNRCLNHLRKPTADGVDSMDVHPHENGASTLERVQRREELRAIVADVHELPETQRTALVLREIDDLSYTRHRPGDGHLSSLRQVAAGPGADVAGRVERGAHPDLRRGPARAGRGGRGPAQGWRARPAATSAIARPAAATAGELRSSTKALAALAPFGLLALLRKLIAAAKLGGSFERRRIGHGRRPRHGRRPAGTAGGVAGTTGARRHGRRRRGSGRRLRHHARRRGRRDQRRRQWHRRRAGRQGRSGLRDRRPDHRRSRERRRRSRAPANGRRRRSRPPLPSARLAGSWPRAPTSCPCPHHPRSPCRVPAPPRFPRRCPSRRRRPPTRAAADPLPAAPAPDPPAPAADPPPAPPVDDGGGIVVDPVDPPPVDPPPVVDPPPSIRRRLSIRRRSIPRLSILRRLSIRRRSIRRRLSTRRRLIRRRSMTRRRLTRRRLTSRRRLTQRRRPLTRRRRPD